MIAIVRLALRRPYTFIVLASNIVIFGVMAAVGCRLTFSPT